ncbi:MAG: hypothetical protein AB7W37_15035 [Syntrophobacteraceae bacterium]
MVFVMLRSLAFLAYQIRQMSRPLLRTAWKKAGCKRDLRKKVRAVFPLVAVESMEMLYRMLLLGARKICGRLLPDASQAACDMHRPSLSLTSYLFSLDPVRVVA